MSGQQKEYINIDKGQEPCSLIVTFWCFQYRRLGFNKSPLPQLLNYQK